MSILKRVFETPSAIWGAKPATELLNRFGVKFDAKFGAKVGKGIVGLVLLSTQAGAGEIKRTELPNSKAHILQAVTVGAGTELIYFSGLLPSPANSGAAQDQLKAEGDTKAQAEAVFKKLADVLAVQGLGFKDVIQLRIFLVADPKSGKLDFNGLQQAYTQFFGTQDQPELPTRTTVGAASLVLPGALIEIEAIAARSAATAPLTGIQPAAQKGIKTEGDKK